MNNMLTKLNVQNCKKKCSLYMARGVKFPALYKYIYGTGAAPRAIQYVWRGGLTPASYKYMARGLAPHHISIYSLGEKEKIDIYFSGRQAVIV